MVLKNVAQVLEKSTGLSDPSVAEFLINLCSGSSTIEEYKKKLEENEAPFDSDLVEKIFTIIKADEKIKQVRAKRLRAETEHETDEFGRSNEIRRQTDGLKKSKNRSQNRILTKGEIYKGQVSNLTKFGAFVKLFDVKLDKHDIDNSLVGLCHISELSNSNIKYPDDVVSKNEIVYVKIIDVDYQKKRISLSMRNIDQLSGKEIEFRGREEKRLHKASGTKRLTSPERWELRQLIASNAISLEDYPELKEQLNDSSFELNASTQEEHIDIELKKEEPKFISKEKRKYVTTIQDDMVQDLQMVKSQNGSLSRAAMKGSQLVTELKQKKIQELRKKKMEKNKNSEIQKDDPLKKKDADIDIDSNGLSLWQKEIRSKKTKYGPVDTMSISEKRRTLPVYKMRSQLLDTIRNNQFVVIVGETGSGKTTQITQYLMEDGFSANGKIIGCTQPRRVAAISVAHRVAEEVGSRVGDVVGYTVRFDDKTSGKTQIRYMTDGMLQREALLDIDMSRYSVIMLDEAHERTIATDVLFALLKKAAAKRPDLKVIVTSATLDSQKFSQYFNNCPILNIPGRTFPVDILYTKQPEPDYLAATIDTVLQIHESEPKNGDILVFLTGQEEIDTACEILYEKSKKSFKSKVVDTELLILPIYSSLPSEVQSKIFEPTPANSRKCVVATNIAETSITIDGIKFVVDPGFVKINVYDAKLGMDTLKVSPISQAQANQRAGRAGRVGPGKCFRLYTELAFQQEMSANTVPEIQRQNLSNTLLMLKAMGIKDLIHFEFMDKPPIRTMLSALEELYNLGAIDDEGELTKMGKQMAELPMEPGLAKSMLFSIELDCVDDMITIIGMLSAPNIFYKPKEKDKLQQAEMRKSKLSSSMGDHLTLLNIYTKWQENGFSAKWCSDNYIQLRSMIKARDVRSQLSNIVRKHRRNISLSSDRFHNFDLVRKALCAGFFKNCAKRDSSEPGMYKTLNDDTPVYMHPSSVLYHKSPDYVVYHSLLLTTREYMNCVSIIEPKWLVEAAPTFFKISEKHTLSRK